MPKPLYTPPKNRQLFYLGRDALDAMTEETVSQIAADLKELDLYRLPYDVVDIKFHIDDIVQWVSADGQIHDKDKLGARASLLMTGIGSEAPRLYVWQLGSRGRADYWEEVTDKSTTFRAKALLYKDFLIALMATKNVQKTVAENKLAGLGIGKTRWRYTTTLSLPKDLQEAVANAQATGRTVRPHLRRGHIRRQHFGPNNEGIKRVWIAPCFVNADEGFESTRDAYNVRAA